MKRYLIFFLLFGGIAATVIALAGGQPHDLRIRWIMLAYFAALTLIFHTGLERTSRGRPQVFIRYYMAATSMKLFLHLGVIIAYAFTHKHYAVSFIVSFLIFYLCFTVFEVMFTWKAMIRKTAVQ